MYVQKQKIVSWSVSTSKHPIFCVAQAKNQQFVATVSNISVDIQHEMLDKGTYQKDCPVPPERLREINFTYYDFDGVVHTDGSLIVLDAV